MKKCKAISIIFVILILSLTSCGGKKNSTGLVFESKGDGTCVLKKIGTCTDKEIVVPETSPEGDAVTEVANGFIDFTDIKSVTLPDTVRKIESYAFANCDTLESVTAKGAVDIESSAFCKVPSLKKVYLSDALKYYISSVDSYGEGRYKKDEIHGYQHVEPDIWLSSEKPDLNINGAPNANFVISEITEENKPALYCWFFEKDHISVNNKAYSKPKEKVREGKYDLLLYNANIEVQKDNQYILTDDLGTVLAEGQCSYDDEFGYIIESEKIVMTFAYFDNALYIYGFQLGGDIKSRSPMKSIATLKK